MNRLFTLMALLALLFSSWFTSASHAEIEQVVNHITQQPNDFPDWLKNAGNVVGLTAGPGIAIWYLWYDTAKVKPRMERTQREQMESMHQRYMAVAKETEERHAQHWNLANTNARSDMHEMTKAWREDQTRLIAAIEKLNDTVGKQECQYDHSRRNAG